MIFAAAWYASFRPLGKRETGRSAPEGYVQCQQDHPPEKQKFEKFRGCCKIGASVAPFCRRITAAASPFRVGWLGRSAPPGIQQE